MKKSVVHLPKALDDVIRVPRKSVLQFNEIFEQIRQKQFEIVDFVRANNGGRESFEAALGEVVERIRRGFLVWILRSWCGVMMIF